ncbi:CBU_0592 family membrane protein [Thalassotalea piscium]|uniref:Putative neutral ceramidase superfamily lipid hydrolase n=1 Tax=Thalassotalea piscium TaxID=1230533 RepID=A0A7X0TTU0_9GAMM|nr:hypothetical protein [Thalassotalea piscium]MBB6543586.1 putative neutral ceramidase superfamily lipid hydrolase [Thalassotalea piscium]
MIVAVLGWFGSILYLVNHGYISVNKEWKPNIYFTGNLIAALALVASSLLISSYQAVVINGFWALISILLIIKFDMSTIAFSKRAFYLGLILILAWSAYIAYKHGINSLAFFTYLGWSSSYVFCLSYFLFCSKKLNRISYLLLNAFAASALLPILWRQENWPVFSLEICWVLISIYGAYTQVDEVHLID